MTMGSPHICLRVCLFLLLFVFINHSLAHRASLLSTSLEQAPSPAPGNEACCSINGVCSSCDGADNGCCEAFGFCFTCSSIPLSGIGLGLIQGKVVGVGNLVAPAKKDDRLRSRWEANREPDSNRSVGYNSEPDPKQPDSNPHLGITSEPGPKQQPDSNTHVGVTSEPYPKHPDSNPPVEYNSEPDPKQQPDSNPHLGFTSEPGPKKLDSNPSVGYAGKVYEQLTPNTILNHQQGQVGRVNDAKGSVPRSKWNYGKINGDTMSYSPTPSD